jgi:hypothetical protein
MKHYANEHNYTTAKTILTMTKILPCAFSL